MGTGAGQHGANKELRFQGQRGKGRQGRQGGVTGPSRKPWQEVKPARAMSGMVQRGWAVCRGPRLRLRGAPGHPCVLADGSAWCRAPCLTALGLRPVGTVQQGLVGVPEELLPGHRVDEAEAGVAVDEGQPAAQFPQRAQPQPADAQPLQGQRVGATAGGVFGCTTDPPLSPGATLPSQHALPTPMET